VICPLEDRHRECVLGLLRTTKNFTAAELAVADELIHIVLTQPLQTDYFAFVQTSEAGDDACIGMFITGPTPATEATWHLYWIAVHPLHHGTDAAQALTSCAEAFVRRRGGYWLLAETSGQASYERARAFYRKQGYVELARVPDYYKRSDDLLIYGKRLDGA
jgi:ribosomal protein S18 acetylase RimI-like enzyme